jgi:hypothetical protein
MGSNQSGFIFGFLLVAFFVYITLKGELPIYAGLILLSPSSGTGTTTSATQQATNAGSSLTANAIVSSGFAALGL